MSDPEADIRALQQLYIDTLSEELPSEMQELLRKLDETDDAQ